MISSKVLIFLAFAAAASAQVRNVPFNSNPNQQDLSGSAGNLQFDSSGSSTQYIGPRPGGGFGARPQGGNRGPPQGFGGAVPLRAQINPSGYVPFNSNPNQQDYSGRPGNVQIDTTGNSQQTIGGGGGFNRPVGPGGRPQGGFGGEYPNAGGVGVGPQRPIGGPQRPIGGPQRPVGGPTVQVNGQDYSGLNVNEPGLQINHSPGNTQYSRF